MMASTMPPVWWSRWCGAEQARALSVLYTAGVLGSLAVVVL